MRKAIKLGMLLLLLLIVIGCGSSGTSSIVSPINVKSEEIINDYIRDQTSAEKKYKNKNVKLTGKVITKGQFIDSPNFFIQAGRKTLGEKTYAILVAYPTDKVKDVNSTKIDDFIVVEGVVMGIVPQDDPAMVAIEIYAGTK